MPMNNNLHSHLGIYTSGDTSDPTRIAIVPCKPERFDDLEYWNTKMPVKVLCHRGNWISCGHLTPEGYSGQYYEGGTSGGSHEMRYSEERLVGKWINPTTGASGDISWTKHAQTPNIPETLSTYPNSRGHSRESVVILSDCVAKTAGKEGDVWSELEDVATLFIDELPVAEPLCLILRDGKIYYVEKRYESCRDKFLRTTADHELYCQLEKSWSDLLFKIALRNAGGDFKLDNILFDPVLSRFVCTDFVPARLSQTDATVAFVSPKSLPQYKEEKPHWFTPETFSFRCRLCHFLHNDRSPDQSGTKPDARQEEAIRSFLKLMPLSLCDKRCSNSDEFLVVRRRMLGRVDSAFNV